jgi:hypothetical protein
MASLRFYDPIVLLRVMPLVSSTCTLLFASDQDFFLGIFNRPETRTKSRPLLPSYFDTFFRRGVVFVVGCLSVTTCASIANLYVRKPALVARQSGWWYVATGALSTGHLLFVPWIAPLVKATLDADKEGTDPNASLDKWLRINRIRMLTVDSAAWFASVAAVVCTLAA